MREGERGRLIQKQVQNCGHTHFLYSPTSHTHYEILRKDRDSDKNPLIVI